MLRTESSVMDDLDNMLSLTSQADNDWYQDSRWKYQAAQERIQVARHQLDFALTVARQGDCRQASRLLVVVQNTLDEDDLTRDEWLEIYVAQMICHARLNEQEAMQSAWRKAHALEPESGKLQEVAARLGLI